MEIFFPKKKRKISMVLFPAEPSIRASIGNIGDILLSYHIPAMPDVIRGSFRKVLELGVPFRELGCEGEERVEFFITIVRPGSIGERWPTYGTFVADLPGKNFEEEMWDV